MKQSALSHFDMPWLPVTGLILFVACFAIYTYWTFKKANKGHYEAASMVPLDDERRVHSESR